MPYIKPEKRYNLDPPYGSGSFNEPDFRAPKDEGEASFVITNLCQDLAQSLATRDGVASPKYEHYVAVIGVLESCKLEFYRRVVVPYEESKVSENGDVYWIGKL